MRSPLSADRPVQDRQRPWPEMSRQTMNPNARLLALRLSAPRRPDLDFIAGFCQFAGNQTRVIAHATGLRRIFAGNDVPAFQPVNHDFVRSRYLDSEQALSGIGLPSSGGLQSDRRQQ